MSVMGGLMEESILNFHFDYLNPSLMAVKRVDVEISKSAAGAKAAAAVLGFRRSRVTVESSVPEQDTLRPHPHHLHH